MENIKNVDTRPLQFMINFKSGSELYKIAHEQGFKAAYEMKFNLPDDTDYENIENKYQYLYFVSSVYNVDISRYMKSLMGLAPIEENAQRIVSMFSINIRQIVKITDRVDEIASAKINYVTDDADAEAKKEMIKAEGTVMGELAPVNDVLLPIIQMAISNDIIVDGCEELLDSMGEFQKILAELIDLQQELL